MTDLDVRKIAEKLVDNRVISRFESAALLDALVEERARTIHDDDPINTNRLWEDTPDKTGDVIGPAKEKYRVMALHELGLEGVWPVKDKQ